MGGFYYGGALALAVGYCLGSIPFGLVLTKLDGTAKGGIALAIAHDLGIPVKLIGIGEKLEDLRPFEAAEFARALVS